jgi:hypothetical protein
MSFPFFLHNKLYSKLVVKLLQQDVDDLSMGYHQYLSGNNCKAVEIPGAAITRVPLELIWEMRK